MSMVGDWVSERTFTIGNANNQPIILAGALNGLVSFEDAIDISQSNDAWYSILDDNGNRESGLGGFIAPNKIYRAVITSTVINGVYNERINTNIPGISLSGSAVVSCTFNAYAYQLLQAHTEKTDNPHDVDASQVDIDTSSMHTDGTTVQEWAEDIDTRIAPYIFTGFLNFDHMSRSPLNGLTLTEVTPPHAGLLALGSVPGNLGWTGGVLASNGKVYGIPYNSLDIVELDTRTGEAYHFLDLTGHSSGGWLGGVLAPNGKMYCIPHNADFVLVVDPVNRTGDTFGTEVGDRLWAGGALAPNGKIYCAPYESNQVLEINPANNTLSKFGDTSSFGSSKWIGAILAPNGLIYCIPREADEILVINPVTRVTTSIPVQAGNGNGSWVSGALAPNGKIYCAPFSKTDVLVIDTSNDNITYIPTGDNAISKWSGTCLAADGKLYGIPYNANSILEIDHTNDTVRTIGSLGNDPAKWSGGTLTPDGRIVCFPLASIHTLVIDTYTIPTFELSNYTNHF